VWDWQSVHSRQRLRQRLLQKWKVRKAARRSPGASACTDILPYDNLGFDCAAGNDRIVVTQMGCAPPSLPPLVAQALSRNKEYANLIAFNCNQQNQRTIPLLYLK
jgi:hypothetical protein